MLQCNLGVKIVLSVSFRAILKLDPAPILAGELKPKLRNPIRLNPTQFEVSYKI